MPDASIRVICRFRPSIEAEETSELSNELLTEFEFPDDKSVVVRQSRTKSQPQVFSFDKVFHDSNVTQLDVYESAAKDTINDVLAGYNGTIFAYGQTGSGKSYSMSGPDVVSEKTKGIIPRACDHIFNHISNDASNAEYTLKCSYLEIYKENIRDLLYPESAQKLRVRETASNGVWVDGLSEHYVSSIEDIIEHLKTGERYRSVGVTKMNANSSRSHSLFILTITQRNQDGSTKEGKLNLADLAGSEKVSKTGAAGETLEEAKKINQSLSALGNCINALTQSNRAHIPYRDSKLTHILRESLGGNSKTTLLVTCSSHFSNVDETISTLKFGQRAKSIKNCVYVNQKRSVKELEVIIKNLTSELSRMRTYTEFLRTEILKSTPDYDFTQIDKKLFGISHETDQSATATTELNAILHSGPHAGEDTANFQRDEGLLDQVGTPQTRRSVAPAFVVSADGLMNQAYLDPAFCGNVNSPLSTPKTPLVHLNAMFDPMALAEAQLKISMMKERYKLHISDLKEEISHLESKVRELEEKLSSADGTSADLTQELETVQARLEEELENGLIRESSLKYELNKKVAETDAKAIELSEQKNALEERLAVISASKTSLESEIEVLHEEKNDLEKQAMAFQAEAQRWRHRVNSASDELRQEISAGKKSLELAQAQVANSKVQIDEMQKELKQKTLLINNQKIELHQLGEENDYLKKNLLLLQAEKMKALNTKLDSVNTFEKKRASTKDLKLKEVDLGVKSVDEVASFKSEISCLTVTLKIRDEELKELFGRLSDQVQLTEEAHESIRLLRDMLESTEQKAELRFKQYEEQLQLLQTALEDERTNNEKTQLELKRAARQLSTQEMHLMSTHDLVEKTQRETQKAATTATTQLEQANAHIYNLERLVDSLHERNARLQEELNTSTKLFRQMKNSLQREQDGQQVNQVQIGKEENKLTRNHAKNIARPMIGGGGKKYTNSPGSPKPNTESRGFLDWLFRRVELPSRSYLDSVTSIKGILWKQSGIFRSWQEHLFYLYDGCLYGFASKHSQVADTCCAINEYSISMAEQPDSEPQYRYQICLSHPKKKSLILCARNLEEMAYWVNNLNQMISKNSK